MRCRSWNCKKFFNRQDQLTQRTEYNRLIRASTAPSLGTHQLRSSHMSLRPSSFNVSKVNFISKLFWEISSFICPYLINVLWCVQNNKLLKAAPSRFKSKTPKNKRLVMRKWKTRLHQHTPRQRATRMSKNSKFRCPPLRWKRSTVCSPKPSKSTLRLAVWTSHWRACTAKWPSPSFTISLITPGLT